MGLFSIRNRKNVSILETVEGNLHDGYNKLVPGTFQHVDQLMNGRQKDKTLRYQLFYTADGQGYFANGTEVEWVITRDRIICCCVILMTPSTVLMIN